MIKHMHVRFGILVLFASTLVSANEVSSEASDLPTYRSSVTQVKVTFFATDGNNRPLDTVTPSDFAVVDNQRVVRSFRSFARSEENAIDLLALVDASGSVASRSGATRSAVLDLLGRAQSTPADTMSVLSFGGVSTAVLCSGGCRAPDALRPLETVKTGGATPLFDALIFAADFSSRHRRAGARLVLVLFSDGYDTISLHSPREAIQALTDAGVMIYSVDIGTPGMSEGAMFLRRISDATGGRYFSPRISMQQGAAAVLEAALEDLRASFVVTYDVPSREAGFHSLRLLPTHNLNLTFHNRNGYNYEPRVR
jgi:VWFA-related protein